MSYKNRYDFFISENIKVLKFYSRIQLAIVYLHINFQSQKILKLLCSFVYFHFQYNLLGNNNSNTNETVKMHRGCRDLLNYTIRIAFKQINKYSWTLRHSISAIDHASFDGAV